MFTTPRFDLSTEPPAESPTLCGCRNCRREAGARTATAAHVEVMGADALALGAPLCDGCASDLDDDAAEAVFLTTLQEVSRETFRTWGRVADPSPSWTEHVEALTYPRRPPTCGFVALGGAR